MRWVTPIILTCLILAAAPLRGDDARSDQVNAAASQAFESLRREVMAAPIGNDLTVGALVERCHAGDELDATLHGAEQIGGTRWLDAQTVQVRLEIPGSGIARTIDRIAQKNTPLLPMPLRVLREHVKKDLSPRTFSATGTSTAASAARRLRPDPSQLAWRSVGEGDRQTAIESARHNAVQRVIDSLATVEWDYGKRRLADALAAPGVTDAIRDWLFARPITSIEFRDDLEVRISLAASPADVWPMLSNALGRQSAVSVPHDAKEWDALRHQVHLRMVPAVGVALVSANAAGGVGGLPALAMPHDPPDWASTVIEADGDSGPISNSKLKTARAAEAVAMAALRARLDALPFDSKLTLGEAAHRDHRIEQALARGLAQAQISKVDYDSPARGAVRMKLTLDLEAVWSELSR